MVVFVTDYLQPLATCCCDSSLFTVLGRTRFLAGELLMLGWLSDAIAGAPPTPRKTGGALFPGTALYSWRRGVHASTELVPPEGAVRASSRMLVIRSLDGECGKFIIDEGKATVALHGKEQKINEFEFLVLHAGAEATWQQVHDPPGSGSEPLVWASARMAVVRPANAGHFPDRDPGKYISDERKVRIPHNRKEVTVGEGEFEFLIIRAAGHAGCGASRQPDGCEVMGVSSAAARLAGSDGVDALGPLYTWQRPTRVEGGILVPSDAVKASERMLVVRTASGECGKFVADEGVAKIALNGREETVDEEGFEFLTLGPHVRSTWSAVKPAAGSTAGEASDGDDGVPTSCVWASTRMAVVRARDPQRYPDRDPGKFIADENKVRVPSGGREVTLLEGEYEFLCVFRAPGALEMAAACGGAEALALRRTPRQAAGGGSTRAAEAAGAAAEAAEALVQRGEKLRTLGAATQSLASEAEKCADLATQLRKASCG